MSQSQHPPDKVLADFGSGCLDRSQSAEVEDHLDDCDRCADTLLNLPETALVKRLRQLVPTTNDGAPPELPPSLVGHPRYDVLERIGTGGMGTVYKARHRLMDRCVALKVVSPDLINNSAAVCRFREEVKAAARLGHPNIVIAYDAEQAGASHVLVMEYVMGVDLCRLVRKNGPLPVHTACEYVRQAALGLQNAFEHGMIHRDIKPQNIMLLTPNRVGDDAQSGGENSDESPASWLANAVENPLVKILDFGLSHLAWDGDVTSPLVERDAPTTRCVSLSRSGIVMGTPDYLAPELCVPSGAADSRSDIYSLGCTLYYLLTGRPPFQKHTVAETLTAHQREQPLSIVAIRQDVPEGLVHVLQRMTAKDPAERFVKPDDVAQALAPFCVPKPPGLSWRPRRLFAVSVAVAFLLVGMSFLPQIMIRIRKSNGQTTEIPVSPGDTVEIVGGGNTLSAIGPTNQSGSIRRFDERAAVASVVFLPNANACLSGARDGGLRIWTLSNEQSPKTLPGHDGEITCVAVSSDGRYGASAGRDDSVRVWDLASEQELRILNGDTRDVHAVQFLPGENRVLLGAGMTPAGEVVLVLWDVDAGRAIRHLFGHTRDVLSVAVSPDGRRALSGSKDHTLRLWDLESGEELRYFDGHETWVWGVAFSHDGQLALSGTGTHTRDRSGKPVDCYARLWDLESGKEIRRFVGHTREVVGVRFCDDGRRVLTASADGTVRLWNMSSGQELHRFIGITVPFNPSTSQRITAIS